MIALFNYGGGMRGLIPAQIMSRIEDATGLYMADMVDLFSGPSTGAILNGALTLRHLDNPTQPRYRARHMVRFYEREGANIFPPDSSREMRGILHDFNNRTLKLSQLNSLLRHGHYDPSYLGRALRALYGDARLSDSLRSLIIPTYNIDGQLQATQEPDETANDPAHTRNNVIDRGGHALWLKNIKTGYPADAHDKTPDVTLYDAVMASCAAPTYYPCHHFQARMPGENVPRPFSGIDGCVFDNPCISYLGAIRRHVPAHKRLMMIVLGTGYTNRSVKREDWNRYGALGIVDPVNDLPLINIFFNASESALMDSFSEEMKDNLFIFNRPLTGGPDSPNAQIDDASPENLARLRAFGEATIEENKTQFDRICDVLVTRRDRKEEEKRDNFLNRSKRFFSFFSGMQGNDRTAMEDHEAQR